MSTFEKPNTNVAAEVNTDEEADAILTDIEGELNDVSNALSDVDYQEALEACGNAQEKINALHVYLTGKANNG